MTGYSFMDGLSFFCINLLINSDMFKLDIKIYRWQYISKKRSVMPFFYALEPFGSGAFLYLFDR